MVHSSLGIVSIVVYILNCGTGYFRGGVGIGSYLSGVEGVVRRSLIPFGNIDLGTVFLVSGGRPWGAKGVVSAGAMINCTYLGGDFCLRDL